MSDVEHVLAHAVARHRQGHLAEAKTVYEAVISRSMNPNINGAALAHLAVLHLKEDRIAAGLLAAEQALSLNADNGTAFWAWLQCHRRLGEPGRALHSLLQRSTYGLPPTILHEMGLCYEAEGDHRKAFLAFKEAKRRISFANMDINRNLLLEYMRAVAAATERTTEAAYTSDLDGEHEPVFLVGFKESGVHKLGHMLAKHPGLRLAVEVPAMTAARQCLNGKDPAGLAAVTDSELRDARRAYFDAINHVSPGPARVVDALPMNVLMIGLIRRMFPSSPIIHCIRHPCEAVLNTFVRPYTLNNVTCHFDRLERTALTYAGIMAIADEMSKDPAMDVSTVRYDDLMTHPNEIVHAIASAVDPTADPTIHYAPRCPVPRWTNYRAEMSRWLPTLQPFAAALGYPAK